VFDLHTPDRLKPFERKNNGGGQWVTLALLTPIAQRLVKTLIEKCDSRLGLAEKDAC
jgi:hypothetical protein